MPCYFCAHGRTRKNYLREHCRCKHKSAVDLAETKNALGYVFHLFPGHTDRVFSKRGESPSSVGHCFVCHSFMEVAGSGYRTIEEVVGGHVCKPDHLVKKTRKPRSTAEASKAAAAPVKTGPSVTVDEDYLMKEYKALGKKLEPIWIEDSPTCDMDVAATLTDWIERAFKAEDLKKRNAEYAARINELTLHTSSTSSTDPAAILTTLKANPKVRAYVTQQEDLKRSAAATPDEDGETYSYDPLDVFLQMAMDGKRCQLLEKQFETVKSELHAELRLKDTELRQAKQEAEARLSEVIELHDRLAAKSASVTPPHEGGATHPVADDAPPLPASPQSESSVPSLLVQGEEEVVLAESAC